MQENLLNIISLSQRYCYILENTFEFDKNDFISEILGLLPRIYFGFYDFKTESGESFDIENDFSFYRSYVDENFYEEIRSKISVLMGEDDVFLETFEEDMKYSDTPVSASISESLADIFQPLYDFISVVRETEGSEADGSYRECRGKFEEYWSQTLCNVMRALNNLKFK